MISKPSVNPNPGQVPGSHFDAVSCVAQHQRQHSIFHACGGMWWRMESTVNVCFPLTPSPCPFPDRGYGVLSCAVPTGIDSRHRIGKPRKEPILLGFPAGKLRMSVAIEAGWRHSRCLAILSPIASASTARSIPSIPGPDASIRLVPPTGPKMVSDSGTTRFLRPGLEGLPNPVANRHHFPPLRMDNRWRQARNPKVPFFPMPSENPAKRDPDTTEK